MSRSLLKLVVVLLVVGIVPFAASLIIVNDLFKQAVGVGLNPEVQAHLESSAEVHRQFFEAEKMAHELATDSVAADLHLTTFEIEAEPTTIENGAEPGSFVRLTELLASYSNVHPRLVSLALTSPNWPNDVVVSVAEPDDRYVTRREAREVTTPLGDGELVLTFYLPSRYISELEELGETLRTFRALETLEDELSAGMRKTYLYFGGGVAILALLIGTFLTRRTTARISRIADAAGRLGAGDLNARVEDSGRDEIGALAREFNRMVKELAISQERLAYLQRVSAWQGIARRLAHEIKNPLTPILLAMQQLDRKYDQYADQPERFRPLLSEALEIVQEEVGTLRALVKEFRDFSRLPKVSPEPVELASFVEDFVRTNPQLTQEASIAVTIVPDAQHATINLDPLMMRRALVNCVQNAIDAATEAHGGDATKAKISMSVRIDDDRAVLEIVDNGTGLKSEKLERAFEPYFTTKETGTGLGLPIVKKIVLDHDGWITMENRTDHRGCRVSIGFPAQR